MPAHHEPLIVHDAMALLRPIVDPERRSTEPLVAIACSVDLQHILRANLITAVREAYCAGHSWSEIAVNLGISKQAAYQRYAGLL